MSAALDKKPLVLIGTSGSHDYLRDASGDRRFWLARVPAEPVAGPLSPEDRVVVNELVRRQYDCALVSDDGAACDGIHDDGAPAHLLCTQCFPDLIARALWGDLTEPDDDDRHDDEQEID